MESTVRINLGCGAKLLPGFINVDMPGGNWSGKKPDVEADVTKRLPFNDGSADQVHAYHVFEHINRWQAEEVLTEWLRIVKPGGLLVLELPCLDKILALFDHFARTGEPLNFQLTMWGLYGDPGYHNEAMTHKWCYSAAELRGLLEARGLEVREEEPKTHVPIRDMRMVARKP